jgi:hypothetical protein
MNPWNSVATYRRNRQAWGLLIAGLIRSAISRPLVLFRWRLAGGDSTVSSIDETYQWFHPEGPVCFFGCGPRAALGNLRASPLPFSPVAKTSRTFGPSTTGNLWIANGGGHAFVS